MPKSGFAVVAVFVLILGVVFGASYLYFHYSSQTSLRGNSLPTPAATKELTSASSSGFVRRPTRTAPPAGPIWDSSELIPGWKQFVDKSLGLAFQYPGQMSLIATADAGIRRIIVTGGGGQDSLTVLARDNPGRLDPLGWLDKNFEDLYRGAEVNGEPVVYSDLKILSNLTIAGQQAVEIQVESLNSYVLFTSLDKSKIYQFDGAALGGSTLPVVVDSMRLI